MSSQLLIMTISLSDLSLLLSVVLRLSFKKRSKTIAHSCFTALSLGYMSLLLVHLWCLPVIWLADVNNLNLDLRHLLKTHSAGYLVYTLGWSVIHIKSRHIQHSFDPVGLKKKNNNNSWYIAGGGGGRAMGWTFWGGTWFSEGKDGNQSSPTG